MIISPPIVGHTNLIILTTRSNSSTTIIPSSKHSSREETYRHTLSIDFNSSKLIITRKVTSWWGRHLMKMTSSILKNSITLHPPAISIRTASSLLNLTHCLIEIKNTKFAWEIVSLKFKYTLLLFSNLDLISKLNFCRPRLFKIISKDQLRKKKLK